MHDAAESEGGGDEEGVAGATSLLEAEAVGDEDAGGGG